MRGPGLASSVMVGMSSKEKEKKNTTVSHNGYRNIDWLDPKLTIQIYSYFVKKTTEIDTTQVYDHLLTAGLLTKCIFPRF